MKILLLGSDGFIGRRVAQALSGHEVYGAGKDLPDSKNSCNIDLLEEESISRALARVEPEVIINCAGIVDNSEKAMLNLDFTQNLLDAAVASKLKFKQIIISGSAAEYGEVDPRDTPTNENTPLKARAGYGLSKLKETQLALDIGKQYGLPVIIARIFNPIGPGMHPRFLVSGLLRQIQEIKEGKQASIEVSRLDTSRDYIDIRDVAQAIKALVEGEPKELVYNIGSGRTATNQQLVELILSSSKLATKPKLIETANMPEPLVAIQADITRISNELGWAPTYTLNETIEEIINANHKR